MENDELSFWLVQGNRSNETSKQSDFLESLGLSTNYEDWLTKRSDNGQNSPDNNIVMEDEEEGKDMDITEQSSDMPSRSLSNNVQIMEEITKRDLKSWLCEPEIHTKFNDALDLKRSGKKRKLDDGTDGNM